MARCSVFLNMVRIALWVLLCCLTFGIGVSMKYETHIPPANQYIKLSHQSTLIRKEVANSNLGKPYRWSWTGSGTGLGKLTEQSEVHALASVENSFIPGDVAQPFKLYTTNGLLAYPGPVVNLTTPVLFYLHNVNSGFCNALWNRASLEDLVEYSPNNTHYVMISNAHDAATQVRHLKSSIESLLRDLVLHKRISLDASNNLDKRIHYVVTSVYDLGNWIPATSKNWICADHNCGLDQVLFDSPELEDDVLSEKYKSPLVLPRLDARYDWLPFPQLKFGNRTVSTQYAFDGCSADSAVKGKVAIITDMGCSYFTKIQSMEKSGAVAVLVQRNASPHFQDMQCLDAECDTQLNIPASMVPANYDVISMKNVTVSYQNTPADNFFLAIDGTGRLAEVGWFLYPSFSFLAWQAQWFNFQASLNKKLGEAELIVPVLNGTIMQGDKGAVANITLPALAELAQYNSFELDMSLSCPGERDTTCPKWDHTVQLYVCCNQSSPLCGMELGRWISPFRRRIGRWLTNVTPLLPLFTTNTCTFTMKTVPWAMPWKPSLNLRFYSKGSKLQPYRVQPLYEPGANFDKNYNKHFNPVKFSTGTQDVRVQVVSVITGHGSDENGCGEFCITSHHFVVNGNIYNKTFDIAGTPLGCAERVPLGVEPNEHGTWLYGRDGWCDGQQVNPWVIDITRDLKVGQSNTVSYFGWFQGRDPNPRQAPGSMILYSYLVFYKHT